MIPGEYVLTVFGKTVAARRPAKLAEIRLAISEQQAGQLLINPDYGICFDWCAEQQAYLAHVQIRKRPTPGEEFEAMVRFPMEG